MSPNSPLHFKNSIRSRILLVAGVLFLGITVVVAIVLISNARLNTLSTAVVEDQMQILTNNADVSREVTALFRDIELIDRSFFGRDTGWEDDDGWHGLDYAAALKHTDSPKLIEALEGVKQNLQDYLQCIRLITGQLETLKGLTVQIWTQLDAFEADVSDWLIYATLNGERTDGIDQVLALNTAYRETMLLIEREHGFAQEVYFERRVIQQRQAVLQIIDDFYTRLQSLRASEPKIAEHGQIIMGLIVRYRETTDEFYETLAKQSDSYDRLSSAKSNTLNVMQSLSEDTQQRIEESRREIDELFTATGVIAVGLSIIVIVTVAVVMIIMIRRYFQRPLIEMTAGIEGFSDGDFSGRIRLGREDEWLSLEESFNAMAENAENLLKDLSLEISTRERVEADLREQRRFLESIVENIPTTILVKEAKDLTYVRLNKAGEKLLGFSRDQVIGKHDRDLYSQDQAEQWSAQDREVLSADAAGSLEIPVMRTSTDSVGERILNTRKVRINDDAGKPVYLLGIAEDITEKMEADETLRAALGSAERANRAKSEFLASMSHELRTPLNAIIGFAQVMIVEVFGKHANPKYLEYAQDIERSSSHLLGIINDILDLSKIEAGQFNLQAEDIDLNDSIQECIKLVAGGDTADENKFTVDVSGSVSSVCTDPQAFRQIMINIMSNATKYTPPDGQITVSAMLGDDDTTIIEVADTGVGIAEKDLVRVLEPFGQARGNVNLTHQGTGLGLSISSKLMELQGGRLKIESEIDAGTRVILTFPARPAAD